MVSAMDRLTTNSPETNYETLMNFAYRGDNGQIFLRYAGEHIMLLTAYMCEQCQKHGCSSDRVNAEQLDGFMGCHDCPLGVLYYCAVQAAELRERLAEYEDTGFSPNEAVENEKLYNMRDRQFAEIIKKHENVKMLVDSINYILGKDDDI